MNRLALSTSLVLALAAPAFANDQLARSVGVAPGTYSLSELVELRAAINDNDHARIRALKADDRSGSAVRMSSSQMASDGHRQLAASIGVDPAEYSLSEVVVLREAIAADDFSRVSALTRGNSAGQTGGAIGVSDGQRQLAAALGVSPSDFSLGELIELREAVDKNDRTRINALLSNAS